MVQRENKCSFICIITEPFGVSLPLSLTCYFLLSFVDLGVPVCLGFTKASATQLINLVQRAVSRTRAVFPSHRAPTLMGSGSHCSSLSAAFILKWKPSIWHFSFFFFKVSSVSSWTVPPGFLTCWSRMCSNQLLLRDWRLFHSIQSTNQLFRVTLSASSLHVCRVCLIYFSRYRCQWPLLCGYCFTAGHIINYTFS